MNYAKLKVLPPDPEIGWMDSKTVKHNCLTLGELYSKMSLFPKKVECSFKELISQIDGMVCKPKQIF